MDSNEVNEERRRPRVEFETEIALLSGSSEIRVGGSSKDVSLRGVFIRTEEKLPVGSECKVEIQLTGMVETLRLTINGHVARQETAGMAVIFDSMDLDTYTHLKNIVRYNYKDPDAV